ncbi:hypothetical protein C2W58_03448 [Bacillus pumilus]|nr:hypothetical protein C2W58_03448 [Bacillus pumilus]
MGGDLYPTFSVIFAKFKEKHEIFAVFSRLFSVERNYY